MPTAVSVTNLSVLPYLASRPVLQNVSFEVPRGQRVLLLGPSGAGKSTLLLALSGVLGNLETAHITGDFCTEPNGLLLQNSIDATVSSTVFRDVAFGAESAGLPALSIGHLVTESLTRVGLQDLEPARSPRQLSGGELQRVCLAGQVALAPQLLLLDEPTAMLDADSAAQVRLAVGQYLEHSGATAIIAEHQFEPWLDLVDRILVLNGNGQIVDDGPAQQIMQDYHHQLLSWGLWVPKESAPQVSIDAFTSTGETITPGHPQGSITALVGPSGSGKTTALTAKLQQLLSEHGAESLGWLPQNAAFTIAGDTVLKSAGATDYARQLLVDLGLGQHLEQNPHELSGGEQRRLALASALAGKPRDLILDEPTVGQDRNNWALMVRQILIARQSGCQIWLATHDQDLVAICDEVQDLGMGASAATETHGMSEPQATPDSPSLSESKPPLSPFGLLGASMLLLIGSWQISSLQQASVGYLALALAGLILGLLGGLKSWKPKSFKILIPALIGIVSIGFSNWWLSSNHDWQPALVTALRVAFFVIPGVLLASRIDPSQLADQAGQFAKLPARPVVASSVAIQRVFDFQSMWAEQVLVRRVRGLTKRNRLAEGWSLTLGLLIEATRSATRTAIAMEARGFSAVDSQGKRIKRTWAVPAKWGSRDGLLLALALVVACAPWFGR
jgi:energy-coupling factor transporter ATP-binding protein EcfA2/energy-coupling factor transporter transmembrane protein EcfT